MLFMAENTNHARLVYIAASAVTAFYLHCICILMAGSNLNSLATTQQWTDQEIETILQYLLTNKSEIGDAGNFKRKTYTAAAETVTTEGRTRTYEQVKTKWQGVRNLI